MGNNIFSLNLEFYDALYLSPVTELDLNISPLSVDGFKKGIMTYDFMHYHDSTLMHKVNMHYHMLLLCFSHHGLPKCFHDVIPISVIIAPPGVASCWIMDGWTDDALL